MYGVCVCVFWVCAEGVGVSEDVVCIVCMC